MEQTNLFEFLNHEFKIDKPIRLIELFAGVGSQAMSLRDLGVEFEHHKVVEFDKYAIKSYNAIHGTNFVTSDIREIHAEDLDVVGKEKYCYVLTYSFPCQDLSKAGKQRGMSKGSNTRSGLLWEVERILDKLNFLDQLPQVLLMENVPDVIGTKNINDFNMWQTKLEQLGYSNYVNVLNAKDFGIPQNRARCFMVSILGNYYEFPKGMPLKFKLKDFLEKEVDEKCYLDNEKVRRFIKNGNTNPSGNGMNGFVNTKDIACTITTNKGEGQKIIAPVRITAGSIYDTESISPTLDTMQGGHRQPCIMIPDVFNPYHAKEVKDVANTITTSCGSTTSTATHLITIKEPSLRIRKLTPLECWRLMGFSDEDFYKAQSVGMSNTQLYKQAGNSIVKQVLIAIFKNLI